VGNHTVTAAPFAVGLALGVLAGTALTRRRAAPTAGTCCRAARVQAAHWRQQPATFRTMALGPDPARRDN
jgi:hypothetical protein